MDLMKPAVGAGALVLALGVAMPTMANNSGNKYDSTESVRNCDDGDTVTLNGPLKLWPPNHKMIDEPVTGESDSGPVTLTLTPVVTDATGGDGGPQHDPDFSATSSDGKTFVATSEESSVTAAFALRAERSGKGDGRTYTINWKFESNNGTCTSDDDGQTPFVITVPHDMRGGADWKPAAIKQ